MTEPTPMQKVRAEEAAERRSAASRPRRRVRRKTAVLVGLTLTVALAVAPVGAIVWW